MKYFCSFIIAFICLLTLSTCQDVCTQKGPCVCVFPNGTGIDLTPSAKSDFFIAQMFSLKENNTQYLLNTYYYHPCFDVMPKINETKPVDTCNIPLSICRHKDSLVLQNTTKDTFKIDNGVNEFLGTSNISQFSADGMSIKYPNGPSSNVILLVCAQTESQLHVYSELDPNNVVLAFYSRDACLKLIEEAGRSLGSTLLIILFSFVIFYLVLGVCTKKFLMGATGLEVVPNLGFWSDLPNLVKDGWAFAISGFKLPTRAPGPVTTPDPNSYDSI